MPGRSALHSDCRSPALRLPRQTQNHWSRVRSPAPDASQIAEGWVTLRGLRYPAVAVRVAAAFSLLLHDCSSQPVAPARPGRPPSDAVRLLPPSAAHRRQTRIRQLLLQSIRAIRDCSRTGGGHAGRAGRRHLVANLAPQIMAALAQRNQVWVGATLAELAHFRQQVCRVCERIAPVRAFERDWFLRSSLSYCPLPTQCASRKDSLCLVGRHHQT